MWFRGNRYGVSIWYVCWGAQEGDYNVEAYKTMNGLAKWFASEAYREVPVHRVGRMIITGKGIEERDTWESREEFLKWAKPLVAFSLPDV